MPVTALVSAVSGGVTASGLSLMLASKRPSILAECDLKGGTVRSGFLQGQVTAGYGLYHLAAAERVGPEALAHAVPSHLWPVDAAGHRKVLPGLTDPAQAAALDRTWPCLSDIFHVLAHDVGHDVYIDAGRLSFSSGRLHSALAPAPLLHQADLVLLVTRNTEAALALTRSLIAQLRGELDEHGTGATALGLLLIEREPTRRGRGYSTHQVGEALGLPVLASLPWDPAVADYLTDGGTPPRHYGRSDLLRHARTATEQIEAFAQRRRIQQQYPAPAANPQLAGVLQRLAHTRNGTHG